MRNILGSLSFAVVLAFGSNVLADPQIQKLDDGVYHFWGAYYSSLIVVGEEKVLITDPANRKRAKLLKEAIAEITDVPVTTVVLTHEHYDHVGGTEVFGGAEIICHQNCKSVFMLDSSGQVPEKVDVEYDSTYSFTIGKTRVELHHYGAGDGVATTLVHLPGENVVVTADLYGERVLTDPVFMEDVNYQGVYRILNQAVALDPKFSITSHTPNNDPEELRHAAKFVTQLYQQTNIELNRVLSGGGGFPAFMEALPTFHQRIDLSEFRHWKNYDQYLPQHVRRMALSIFHGG